MVAAVRIEEMTFRSEGVDCAARVYRPDAQPGETTPCIVMANGFSLTRDDGLPVFAERFADVGITALTFDFRHLGGSGGEPRQLIDGGRQQADYRAAVSFARGLEGVNRDAVAVWGFSLGGGHAIYTAAGDREVAAAIALCPMTDVLAFVRAMPTRNSLDMTLTTLRNLVGPSVGSLPRGGASRLQSPVHAARGAPRFRCHPWRSLALAQRVPATFIRDIHCPSGPSGPPRAMPAVRHHRRAGSRGPARGCRTDRRTCAARRARLLPDRSFRRFPG
jgi:fermentation-respiration switch protein FrsA (DUF1100 family)